MSEEAWHIPPVARVRDGWLHPSLPRDRPLPAEAERVRRLATSIRIEGGTLLLRGGLLERERPHPRADLDLILVAAPGVTVDCTPLQALGRPLDLLRLDPASPDRVLATLALTRALPIAGQPFASRPMPIDEDWLTAHWYRYGALHRPGWLDSQGLRRVREVKLLLRAAGLLRVWTHHEWSRDLVTCATWIAAAESAFRPLIDLLLHSLDEPDPSPIDVRDLQTWLRACWWRRPTALPGAPDEFGQSRLAAVWILRKTS